MPWVCSRCMLGFPWIHGTNALQEVFLSTKNIENEALMGLNPGRLNGWNPKVEGMEYHCPLHLGDVSVFLPLIFRGVFFRWISGEKVSKTPPTPFEWSNLGHGFKYSSPE